MAYDIVVNKGPKAILVSALKKEVDFVEGFMDEMYSTVVSASNYWQGDAYEAFASMLGKYANYFYNYIDMLTVYIEALDGPAEDAMTELEQKSKAAFNDL